MMCNTPPSDYSGKTTWDKGISGDAKSLLWQPKIIRSIRSLHCLNSEITNLHISLLLLLLEKYISLTIFFMCVCVSLSLTLAVVPCSQHLEWRVYSHTVQPAWENIWWWSRLNIRLAKAFTVKKRSESHIKHARESMKFCKLQDEHKQEMCAHTMWFLFFFLLENVLNSLQQQGKS